MNDRRVNLIKGSCYIDVIVEKNFQNWLKVDKQVGITPLGKAIDEDNSIKGEKVMSF